MTPRPDTSIVAGKYRLVRMLGEGAMGAVWQAEHLVLRSQLAIKFIQLDTAAHPEALSRFLREAQLAASLRSPHVVQIIDHGVDGDTPYIAMELLEGETLADRLRRVGRLDPFAVARIMTHVGRAIGRAHELEIVHRDLKPENIFLVRNDDDELAKVLDFGIAKANAGAGLGAAVASNTRTGDVFGTPHYMSPEQTQSAKALDFRTDIWAMGVIAFECLLGSRPFEAETLGGILMAICARPLPIPSELGPVPAGFDAWFTRACSRTVEARFSSAREATVELRRLCEISSARALPSSLPPSTLDAGPAEPSLPAPARVPADPTVAPAGSGSPHVAALRPHRSPVWAVAALGLLAGASAVFAWPRSKAPLAPLSSAVSAREAARGPALPAPLIAGTGATTSSASPSASNNAQPATATSGAAPSKHKLHTTPAGSAAAAPLGVQLPGTGGLVNLGL